MGRRRGKLIPRYMGCRKKRICGVHRWPGITIVIITRKLNRRVYYCPSQMTYLEVFLSLYTDMTVHI